ncbi:right-handed parallel beta-helix repeat-containing protein [Candidatus Woesearchaeota archaeon]|nr:right-handed parallel beta-helix repeat-containing protein [Candidatus Woesearchaeota archaeon]
MASAEVDVKSDKIVIKNQESLASLLRYQELNSQEISKTGEQIISREGKVCYLHRPMHIAPQSTFRFEGKDCRELRLYSGTYIRITGTAYFMDIKITSADRLTKEPIQITRETYAQKRPHIYTDAPADYVHIENSEFSYLGSYSAVEGSTWGVSFWHLKSGFIDNSKFHHNYFGLYTWETKNVVIQDSVSHDNLEYGMDFHDYSDNFIVQNNIVYNNGNHGIIFSKYCVGNKILNNYVYNHTLPVFVKGVSHDYGVHGIMLHKESNHNLVSGNVLKNNDRAIFVYQSQDNIIENNIILGDRRDGIYMDSSSNNIINNNIAFGTGSYGLYSYNSYDNQYDGNYFEKGSYFKDELGDQKISFSSPKRYVPKQSVVLEELKKKQEKISEKNKNIIPVIPTKSTELVKGDNSNMDDSDKPFLQRLKIPSFGDFVDYKRNHILAIASIAMMIFGVEIVYKRFQK